MQAEAHPDINWRELLFDPEARWLDRLRKLSKRRFWDEATAETAYTAALDRLFEDDFRRLRAYQGRCAPGTFLNSIFRNLLEDYAITVFGKCRPPVWIQNLGGFWDDLFKRLCCEHRSPQEVRHSAAWSHIGDQELIAACRMIKGRVVHCGAKTHFADIDDIAESDLPTGNIGSPEEAMSADESTEILSALSAFVGADAATTTASRVSLDVRLQPEDIVLLRMVYGDGLSISAAARFLGEPEHRVRHRHQSIIGHLKTALRERGLSSIDMS